MPEIYEVKRIAAALRSAQIEGKVLTKVELYPRGEKILLPAVAKELEGRRLLQIVTKAKYTFFQLDRGVMIWHYRFTGLPHVVGQNYRGKLEAIFHLPVENQERFCRLAFFFSGGAIIRFLDQRCLATISLASCQKIAATREFTSLAPDLSSCVMPSYAKWHVRLTRTQRTLKQELQCQKTSPSGIGNYLACEILAHAKLDPWQPANALNEDGYHQLCKGIEAVKECCEQHVDYRWFLVFNRLTCRRCGQKTLKKKHLPTKSSQMTHCCPFCQQRGG